MADLRRLATELGWSDVATYVQSGNLVFTSSSSVSKLASSLRDSIASDLGVACDVVVLTAAELKAAADANPFPVDEPKKVHLAFRDRRLTKDEVAAVAGAQAKSEEKGSPDRVEVVGATVYMHTPDGLGRSDLAARLGRMKGAGTARNWTTVTKLLELLDH